MLIFIIVIICLYAVVFDKEKKYLKKSCMIIAGLSVFLNLGAEYANGYVYIIGGVAFLCYICCDTRRISTADYRDGFSEDIREKKYSKY